MKDYFKNHFWFIFTAFMVLTAFFIGIFLLIEVIIFKQNAVKIPAEIVDIHISYDEDDGNTEFPCVTYEYNDRTYNRVILRGYKGKISVGKQISILCDSKNPRKIYSTDSNQYIAPVFFVGFSGFFIILAILEFIKRRKYDYRRFL